METTLVYRGNIGLMENKMETTTWDLGIRVAGRYWGNIGIIMEKKMEVQMIKGF